MMAAQGEARVEFQDEVDANLSGMRTLVLPKPPGQLRKRLCINPLRELPPRVGACFVLAMAVARATQGGVATGGARSGHA